jgi:hypothetical protein
LKSLSDASASKEDISRVRAEAKKIYDGLHVGKRNRNFMIIQSEFSTQSSWIYEHMCGECVSERILLSENINALANSTSQSIEQDLHKLLKKESESTEV